MKYDWESAVKHKIGEMQDLLPDNFQIVGVAVESIDDGQGALIEASSIPPHLYDVVEADVRKDILNDAKAQYEVAYNAAFGSKS